MRVEILLVGLCALAPLASASPEARDWVTEQVAAPGWVNDENKLAEELYHECRVTRLGTAVDRLATVDFLELSEELATYYAGHSYTSRKGFTAYLVRAVFANDTGQFTLFYDDGNLLIRHRSLGNAFTPRHCPLIVQLPTPPKSVVIEVGGAK